MPVPLFFQRLFLELFNQGLGKGEGVASNFPWRCLFLSPLSPQGKPLFWGGADSLCFFFSLEVRSSTPNQGVSLTSGGTLNFPTLCWALWFPSNKHPQKTPHWFCGTGPGDFFTYFTPFPLGRPFQPSVLLNKTFAFCPIPLIKKGEFVVGLSSQPLGRLQAFPNVPQSVYGGRYFFHFLCGKKQLPLFQTHSGLSRGTEMPRVAFNNTPKGLSGGFPITF